MKTKSFDAIVVGGNLAGLISAWLLGELGYRTLLVERGPKLGGVNASFATPDGSTFDMGMHVLDYMRSPLTTRLFSRVAGDSIVRTELKRAIALRGQTMPYAPLPAQMPAELQALLKPGTLVDDIGAAAPTRERLAAVYGEGYATLIYDEVLPSYRCEQRHRDLGVDASRLLTNLYPWFFPRAERPLQAAGESRSFHDRLRRGETQFVLYPKQGGFAGFSRAFVRALDLRHVEVKVGAGDLSIELQPGTHTIRHIETGGERYQAEQVFWATNWRSLCGLLGLPCQNLATDRLLLGSFGFDREAEGPYNEIIVGDPALHLDRVSFPGRFAQSGAPQLQVEFAFPAADTERPLDAAHWRRVWLDDLRRLGLIGDHQVREFDFRQFQMHFNSFGAEGEPHVEADPSMIAADSNIVPVAPSVLNRNLNASVPRYLDAVLQAVKGF